MSSRCRRAVDAPPPGRPRCHCGCQIAHEQACPASTRASRATATGTRRRGSECRRPCGRWWCRASCARKRCTGLPRSSSWTSAMVAPAREGPEMPRRAAATSMSGAPQVAQNLIPGSTGRSAARAVRPRTGGRESAAAMGAERPQLAGRAAAEGAGRSAPGRGPAPRRATTACWVMGGPVRRLYATPPPRPPRSPAPPAPLACRCPGGLGVLWAWSWACRSPCRTVHGVVRSTAVRAGGHWRKCSTGRRSYGLPINSAN